MVTIKNAPEVAATTDRSTYEIIQPYSTTRIYEMTRERLNDLISLADAVNNTVDCAVSLRIGKYDVQVLISMFWCDEYMFFSTSTHLTPNYNEVYEDQNLEKAEAFLRSLYRMGQVYKGVRP